MVSLLVNNQSMLSDAYWMEMGDRPWMIHGDRSLSFADGDRMTRSLIATWAAAGLHRGETVAMIGATSVDYLLALTAALRMGVVVAPLSTRWPDGEINNALETISTTWVWRDGAIVRRSMRLPCQSDSYATVFFTSGSSGSPKPIRHTLANHYYSAIGSSENIPFGANDRWLLDLPLNHVGGFSILMRSLVGGGAIVIPDVAGNIASTVVKHGVTHISVVPTQLWRLIQSPDAVAALKKLNAILIGGQSASLSLIQQCVAQSLPIYQTYGSTEMASQITTSRPDEMGAPVVQAGHVLPHRKIKIENGDIWVAGETLGDVATCDGWYATGDVGKIDASGRLIVIGRRDRMFISGGENIHPEEIERVLLALDGVRQAIVAPVVDDEYGYRPVAVVERDGGRIVDPTELDGILPRFKIPKIILPWPSKWKHEGYKIKQPEVDRYIQEMC